MASMTDGTVPVGHSFEVYAANEGEATEQAWRAAEAAGLELGRTLYIEQIEAGRWEVVLEDNGPAGSGIAKWHAPDGHNKGIGSFDRATND